MDWKSRLSKTPFIVLFIVLISVGVGTAAALITITLSGDVIITGFLGMTGDKITDVGNPTNPSDAATKGYVDSAPGTDTLALLGCSTDQVARFDGNNWVCGKQILKNNLISTVDSAGDVGRYTSIAIGIDGNPVISYSDDTNDDLKVVHCGNTSCSAGNTITTVDSTGFVGTHSSIAIGTDDNPVISYLDNIHLNDDLKVVHCGNASCSSGNTITTVDSAGDVGLYSSIAIGTDNNPVISYYDATNQNLKVAHCGDTSCSAGNTITTIDSPGFVGTYSSIAIGTDNNPVISYWHNTNFELKVAHCGNTSCSLGNNITTVDTIDQVGLFTSIAIGLDNNPVISYYDQTNNDLKVAHCGDTSCSAGNTITAVDSAGDVGRYTSIAIGTDNNPVISYIDETNFDLKVVHCGNTSCSAGNTITTIDSAGDVGRYTSIAIGTDNNPVISYLDATNFDLKVAVDGVVLIFE